MGAKEVHIVCYPGQIITTQTYKKRRPHALYMLIFTDNFGSKLVGKRLSRQICEARFMNKKILAAWVS